MDLMPHNGERGGAVGVEMALIWVAMLGLVTAAVQVTLVFYAGQLALTAAQDGVHAGVTQNAAAGRAAAQHFLDNAAGTAFTPTAVSASLDPAGGVLQVRVTGTVLSVVPGVRLTVDKSAVGAVERATP